MARKRGGKDLPDLWRRVERYLERLLPPDPALTRTLRRSARAGLPEIQVPPLEGRLLEILVRLMGARRVLEIGTLGGYSTLWMARALPPGGRLITLERDPSHVRIARDNLRAAGYASVVEVRQGPALSLLDEMLRDRGEPFDLIFLDADKAHNAEYFDRAVHLGRPGGLIVVDNVVWHGQIVQAGRADPDVRGIRRLLDRVRRDPRVDATALPLVGARGYDGVLIARLRSPVRPARRARANALK